MTEKLQRAIKEYIDRNVPALSIMEKYGIEPAEFWRAYAQLKTKAPK